MRIDLSSLLGDVFTSVAEGYSSNSEEMLTGFSAAFGQNSTGGLMVIGRAVNGWTNSWRLGDIQDLRRRQEILQDVEEFGAGPASSQACPMSWVSEQWGSSTKYNTARSAFWRCIRNVVAELGLADVASSQWSSELAWTNLYKISPADGGNPSQALIDAQHLKCRVLLHSEIYVSAATRILFLTGLDWAYSFLPELNNVRFAPTYNRQVALSGSLMNGSGNPVSIVVATHPQGKDETRWANEVCVAFSRR